MTPQQPGSSLSETSRPRALPTATGAFNAATQELEQHAEWATLSRLPLRIRVEVPLPRFKVRDLLALRPGTLVQSVWTSTDDVPFIVASAQLGWAEFEVVEQKMAVRMTKLA